MQSSRRARASGARSGTASSCWASAPRRACETAAGPTRRPRGVVPPGPRLPQCARHRFHARGRGGPRLAGLSFRCRLERRVRQDREGQGRPERARSRVHADPDVLSGTDGAARRRAVGPDVHHHALTMRGPRPGRILVSEAELRARIAELGGAIARDYAGESPIVVGVLQGAFLFMADLIRAIAIDLTTDFIGVSSYSSAAKSSGQVRLLSDLSMPIEGRQVLIVEDIVDTGLTLAYLKRNLEARHPKRLRTCVLVDKIERRQVEIDLDYVGFTIPNVFVVGYGFDYGGLYRNLPYIAELEGG